MKRIEIEFPLTVASRIRTRNNVQVFVGFTLEKPHTYLYGEKNNSEIKSIIRTSCKSVNPKNIVFPNKNLLGEESVEIEYKEPYNQLECKTIVPGLLLLSTILKKNKPVRTDVLEAVLDDESYMQLKGFWYGGVNIFIKDDRTPTHKIRHILNYPPPPYMRLVLFKTKEEVFSQDTVIEETSLIELLYYLRAFWDGDTMDALEILKETSLLVSKNLASPLKELGIIHRIPFYPIEKGWYLTILPSSKECSENLLYYRERISRILESISEQRIITQLSFGGTVSIL